VNALVNVDCCDDAETVTDNALPAPALMDTLMLESEILVIVSADDAPKEMPISSPGTRPKFCP
jgi:hypothetical protein